MSYNKVQGVNMLDEIKQQHIIQYLEVENPCKEETLIDNLIKVSFYNALYSLTRHHFFRYTVKSTTS